MPVEIERKFLVKNDDWRAEADNGVLIRQGYILDASHCSVRVRIRGDDRCTLTTKLPRNGTSRYEFEQDIALREAEGLMDLCGEAVLEKRRYIVPAGRLMWEIDVYEGANKGLVVAEIELHEEDQDFMRPAWLGEEVSGVERYQNSRLACHAYQTWTDDKVETVGS